MRAPVAGLKRCASLTNCTRRRQAGYIPAAAFVNANLGLGEYDQAFVWLERAYEERSAILQFLKVHPFFDPCATIRVLPGC